MKSKYSRNRGIQSVNGNQTYLSYRTNRAGARHGFYRSVILAVSGSLFCAAAAEQAAAQSPAASTLGETAQDSPPEIFGGLNLAEDLGSPVQAIEPVAAIHASDLRGDVISGMQGRLATEVPVGSISATSGPATDTSGGLALPPLPGLEQPKVYQNEVSASADFMFGTGTITVPIGYAFHSQNSQILVNAISANRSTVYYGGTVSYSYGRSWYLDFSAEDGRSTGSTSITIPGANGSIPASFNVNDTWYQLYLRYNFQNFLAGTRFRAFLRGGVSLVDATLTTVNKGLNIGQHYGAGDFYSEHDDTSDYLGNLGFGLTYSLYSTVRLKMGLQLDGEGFGGDRSQDINETYVPSNHSAGTTIHDTVYGTIGALTLHADFRLGQSGRWKMTGDVGGMTKYSFVTYPEAGTKEELLYGPYVKVGASYVF